MSPEKVDLEFLSNQNLSAIAQILSTTTCLLLWLKFPFGLPLTCTNSIGSRETEMTFTVLIRYSWVHVCWSEHSDSSFVYGFMSLDCGFGTMTATTIYIMTLSS